MAIFQSAIQQYGKVGGKTKASISFYGDVPIEVVPLKLKPMWYMLILRSKKIEFGAGLTDIHDAKAFTKVFMASGSGIKAGHIRWEHYGILCLCGFCSNCRNVCINYLLDHIRAYHKEDLDS